jgi:transcriptional regulator with XRE-family HTH domain
MVPTCSECRSRIEVFLAGNRESRRCRRCGTISVRILPALPPETKKRRTLTPLRVPLKDRPGGRLREAHEARKRADRAFRLASRTIESLARPAYERRQVLGRTTAHVALAAKVSKNKIWLLEAGLGNHTLRTLTAIGRALRLELAYLPARGPLPPFGTANPRELQHGRLKPASALRQSHGSRSAADPAYRRATIVLGRLAHALRDRRVRLRLSEDEVAKAAGVVQLQVARVETASGNPTVETLARLGAVLGLDLVWRDRRAPAR